MEGGADMAINNPAVAEETADLVCTHNFEGAILSVDGPLEKLTGYTLQEAGHMRLSDLIEPAYFEQALQDVIDQIGGGAPVLRRMVLRTKSGGRVTCETFSRILFDKGKPIAVRWMAWQPRPDPSPDRDRPTDPELESRLARFSKHLKHLHRLNVRKYSSLDQVFDDFLRTGCEIFNLPAGLIHSSSPSGQQVRASHGLPEGFTVASDGFDVGSQLSAPILVDGNLYGRLSFLSVTGPRRRFSPEEREIVEMMGRSLGRSIFEHQIRADSGRAARLERDRNEMLEMIAANEPIEAVLEHLVRMIERQCAGGRVAVILLEEQRVAQVIAPGLPRFYSRLASRIEAVTEDGERNSPAAQRNALLRRLGIETAASAPLLSGSGQLLGLLALHFPEGRTARAEDQSLLDTAARLAAIAIEKRQLAGRLEHQVTHDDLTGLPNRLYLIERIAEAIRSNAGEFKVLYLDLDRFKQINDALGHAVGDQLLRLVGERLREVTGVAGFVARLAGDEFAVLLGSLAEAMPERPEPAGFLEMMRRPFLIGGREVFATASIGVSQYPRDGEEPELLLRNAERAMQQAKRHGKNDWRQFTRELQTAPLDALEVENALRHALDNGEFLLRYQPIVLMDGTLDGFEALLSWDHPVLGWISPSMFIPLAEEAGLISEIGTWVLEQVCAQGAAWRRLGYAPVRVAVNVSALQFGRPGFFEAVRSAIVNNQMEAQWLDLELTESVVLRDIEASSALMQRLRAMGVRVSIDDFGTGYSSLSYLRRLPLDTLKIDRAFLRDLTSPGGSMPLVQTIVNLAHQHSLEVIAEGVETQDQLDLLRAAGCDKAQGHLFGRPQPAASVEPLLRGRHVARVKFP